MEEDRAQIQDAAPVRALPDPDAWSARWAILLAVLSLVAWIAPMAYLDDDSEAIDWVFPWSEDWEDATSLVWGLVQPVTAVAVGLVVLMLRGVRRGIALACLSLTALLANAWVARVLGGPGMPEATDARPAGMDLALLLAVLGGLAVAVGSHLRKRSPSHGPARALCALGGLFLVLTFVIPLGRRPLIALYFDAEARQMGWPLGVVGVLLLFYAYLGLRQLGAGSGERWFADWTSRLGRILLVVPPLGYVGSTAILFSGAPFDDSARLTTMVVPALLGWATMAGIVGGFGVGVAAYLEGRIVKDSPRQLDPERAARAFE